VPLSGLALAISSALQAGEISGTPLGLGTEPTTAGTMATVVPILTGLVGATGGWGMLLNIAAALLSSFAGAKK